MKPGPRIGISSRARRAQPKTQTRVSTGGESVRPPSYLRHEDEKDEQASSNMALRPIIETCEPRPDVLSGGLTDAHFADRVPPFGVSR